MKKLLYIFFFVFSHLIVYGQNEVIYYEVDTILFNKKVGNNYLSDSIDAKIMCIILPMSYDKALPGFEHQSNNKIEIVDNSDLIDTKRRVRYKKGQLTDINSVTIIEAYLIEVDEEKTITLIGTYDAKYRDIILNKIEMAARSIRIR